MKSGFCTTIPEGNELGKFRRKEMLSQIYILAKFCSLISWRNYQGMLFELPSDNQKINMDWKYTG